MKTINKSIYPRVLGILLLLISIGPSFSCFAPVFSELQSARLAGPGNAEITPSYSRVEGESEHVQDHFGIQAGVGIRKWLDFRIRYEYANVGPAEPDNFGVNLSGTGWPSICLSGSHLERTSSPPKPGRFIRLCWPLCRSAIILKSTHLLKP
jgi:hypothetical protein